MDTRDTRSRPSCAGPPASWRASSAPRPWPTLDDATRAQAARRRGARRRLARAARRRRRRRARSRAGSRPRSSPTRSAARSPTSRSPARCWPATSRAGRGVAPTATARSSRSRPTLHGAAVVAAARRRRRCYAVDAGDDADARVRPRARGRRLPARARWRVDRAPGASGADLTRAVRPIPAGSAGARDRRAGTRLLTDDDLAAWTALGLALTSADLVGVMRGVLDVTVAYAAERRQYGVPGRFVPGGAAPARRGALPDGGFAERRRCTRRGRSTTSPPGEARRRRPGGQGVLRPRRAHGVRDRGAGARRDRQHLGVHRPRVPAARAAVVAVVRRRRRAAPRARATSGWG